jgi:hypothetical protein
MRCAGIGVGLRIDLTPNKMKYISTLIIIFSFLITGLCSFSQTADSAFTDINKAFLSPLKVSFLDLSNQNLKIISDDMSKFENLKTLFLTGNPELNFEKIFHEISQCKKLKNLYLDFNNFKTLPKEIGELKTLEELFLRNNQIISLPKEIGNLKLKNLDLSNNHMNDEMSRKLFKLIPDETIVNTNNEVSDINQAIKFYDEGNKATSMGNLILADSLYTLSIKIAPDNNAYFNRAVVRNKMHDIKGYCLDLGTASGLNDIEATQLYWKDCGIIDSVFYNKDGDIVKRGEHAFFEVVSKSKYTTYVRYKKMDLNRKVIVHYEVINNDTTFYTTPVPPKYSETEENIVNVILKNVIPTAKEKKSHTFTFVLITFIVIENGTIANIIVSSELEKSYDERLVEALKTNMKKWEPAKYENRPVKYKKYVSCKLYLD